MLKIAICDDNNIICSEIESIILEYSKTSYAEIEVEIFFTGESLLDFIRHEHQFDLIFLDIELITTTGINIGNAIRNDFNDNICKIVFISAVDGYDRQLFDLQPFNFLKKPINNLNLKKCIRLASDILERDNKTFEYKKGYNLIKINIKDILYFEKEDRKIKIVSTNEKNYFYDTLDTIKDKLPDIFIMSHRAFLVNFDKIILLNKNYITMVNNDKIPVSQRNLKAVRTMLIELERNK